MTPEQQSELRRIRVAKFDAIYGASEDEAFAEMVQPKKSWAEANGVAENWPEYASSLISCRIGDDYYEHAYNWNWVYRYDGPCPYHPSTKP